MTHKGIEYPRKTGIGNQRDIALCLSASDWRGLNRNQKQTAILETKGSDIMVISYVIRALGLDDYLYALGKSDEFNTSARIELHALNSDGPVAVGSVSAVKYVVLYWIGGFQ